MVKDQESAPRYVFAETLYVGDGSVLNNALVAIENGRFVEVTEVASSDLLPAGALVAAVAAPGYIDIQINGAMDLQFTDDPTPEAVEAIVLGARAGGTAHVLPTFTTAPGDQYTQALRAVETAKNAGVMGILGAHIEGPFLSPERPGIHAPANIRPMTQADIGHLKSFSGGVLLVTVAPECQANGMIRQLSDAGVIVFAGHSEATQGDVFKASSEGLRGATHLFNAMSQMSVREPGLVGSVLASQDMFAGIIADGHHVSWSNIAIAARLKPAHLCLVTDSMRSLEGQETTFDIQGKCVSLENGMLADKSGILAGAHIALDACVRNVIEHCGVSTEQAICMVTRVPAKALGLDDELGLVSPGYRASLTLLSPNLFSESVIVDGVLFDAATKPGSEGT